MQACAFQPWHAMFIHMNNLWGAYLDQTQFDRVKKVFLLHVQDFQSFRDQAHRFYTDEIAYKQTASSAARKLLAPYVDGTARLHDDRGARELGHQVFRLTNILGWRDIAYVDDVLLDQPGDLLAFMNLMLDSLKKADQESWGQPLGDLLAWLNDKGCPANLTKLLPTYFLFLWDPARHIAIKPAVFDRFLKGLGEAGLGKGKPLTVEAYQRVLGICAGLRDSLSEWQPQDNIDIHSFAWVIGGYPDKSDVMTITNAVNGEGISNIRQLPPSYLNRIYAGPPGTGKTTRVMEEVKQRFGGREGESPRYAFVTFHPAYGYEDFVEGIRPVMGTTDGQVRYAVVDGIFKHLARQAMDHPDQAFALVIDEINRANIASVFGELITLLEPDKRMHFSEGKWQGGLRLKLPYTHASHLEAPLFGLPDNLYLLGTMNSADRSIALMDLALRRRFQFEEIMPDPTILKSGIVQDEAGEMIVLDRMLDAINQRIEYLYDRDHTIGHAYLMGIDSLDALESVFRTRLIPLLQEYFYNDWEKIQLVLADLVDEMDADNRPKAHKQAIVVHQMQRPGRIFSHRDDAYQSRRSYSVSEDLSAASFRKIYEDLT